MFNFNVKKFIGIAITACVMFVGIYGNVPKILMVGATPTEGSIANNRFILLNPRFYDTWFLDQQISEPVPKNCLKGDFNNPEFMSKVIEDHKETFDYVVIDYSVTKFMKIHALESLVKLLNTNGSLFIQGIGGLTFIPDQPCETEEEFKEKCEEYFKKHFSDEKNLLYAFPPFFVPPLPKPFTKDFTKKFEIQKELVNKLYRLAFEKYCNIQLKSSCKYSKNKDSLLSNELEPIIHPQFIVKKESFGKKLPQIFTDYLYQITPYKKQVAQVSEPSPEKQVIKETETEKQVTQKTETKTQVAQIPETAPTEKVIETPKEEIIIQKVLNETNDLLRELYENKEADQVHLDLIKALDDTNKIKQIKKNEFIDFKALAYEKAHEAWVFARSNCINYIKDKSSAEYSSFKKLIELADQIIPVLANREKSLRAEYEQKMAAYKKEIDEKGKLSPERSKIQTETFKALSTEEFGDLDLIIYRLHEAARNNKPLSVPIPTDSSLHIKLKALSDGLWVAGITRGDLLALEIDTLRKLIKAYK